MRAFLRTVFIIVEKDIITEWRNRGLFSGMILFSILVVLIFNFALELETRTGSALIGGLIWTTLLFTGIIGLNHSMPVERDTACLDGLLLAPVDRSVIYFGKVVSIWIMMLIVAMILLPMFFILYDYTLFSFSLIAVILLGTFGYALCGTLLAAMAMQSRYSDLLLPLILFPVTFPLFLAAIKASGGILQRLPLSEIEPWINLLLVFDVIFVGLGMMLFDPIMEE